MIMNLQDTYILPEYELTRYEHHGIARADIGRMSVVPLDRRTIDTRPLLDIAKPQYIWMKQSPGAPLITIASDQVKAQSIPPSATELDPNQELVSLELIMDHTHPSRDCESYELNPVYAE